MEINLDGVSWIIHTDTSTGGINKVASAPSSLNDVPVTGSVVGSETLYHFTIREESTYNFSTPAAFMTQYHRSGNSWVDRGARPTDYYNWHFGAAAWVVDSTRVLRDIRMYRTAKLRESDWTQGVDSPLTDEKKAEWVTYRQALRDIMKDFIDDFGASGVDDPEDVVWPTAPS